MSSVISALQKAKDQARTQVATANPQQDLFVGNPLTTYGVHKILYLFFSLLLIGAGIMLFFLHTQMKQVSSLLEESIVRQKTTFAHVERLAELAANEQVMLYQLQQQGAKRSNIKDLPRNSKATVNTTDKVSKPSNENIEPAKVTDSTDSAKAKDNFELLQGALPLHQAPQNLQNLLNSTKISGHLFDENKPKNSFVIISGKVFQQGDSVADGVRLVKIENNSMYVEYQSKYYFLPSLSSGK